MAEPEYRLLALLRKPRVSHWRPNSDETLVVADGAWQQVKPAPPGWCRPQLAHQGRGHSVAHVGAAHTTTWTLRRKRREKGAGATGLAWIPF